MGVLYFANLVLPLFSSLHRALCHGGRLSVAIRKTGSGTITSRHRGGGYRPNYAQGCLGSSLTMTEASLRFTRLILPRPSPTFAATFAATDAACSRQTVTYAKPSYTW